MLDERALPRHVAFVHAVDLRHGDVRLVDDAEEVVGEVVEQGVGRLPRRAPVDVPRVVLDPGTEAHLAHHLQVERRAHPKPLCFEQLVLRLELLQAMPELLLDRFHRVGHPLLACNVVARGEDGRVADVADDLAGGGLDQSHPLDRVAEQPDAKDRLFVRGVDLDRVASHPERPARQ